MGTINVIYQGIGFWIRPSYIEVLSEYVCETFESIGVSTFSQGLQNIYIECDSNRKGENIGMVDILFDLFITSSNDKTSLMNLFEQTKTLIFSKGSQLSIEILDEFEKRKTVDEDKIHWAFPIQTSSLAATVNIMIQVLNGTWASNNYEVYYIGFPNIVSRPEI